MTSAVFITPVAAKDAATAFAVHMGWQDSGASPGTFSVPLSSGNGTTHYGCHAVVGDAFKAIMADPPPEAAPLLAALIISLSDALWGLDHFSAVLAAHGLIRVAQE